MTMITEKLPVRNSNFYKYWQLKQFNLNNFKYNNDGFSPKLDFLI